MSLNEPKDHHYAPQFYLRNFACDPERKKVMSVTKHGDRAVWQAKSIEYLGKEEDLYTTSVNGIPISVERAIGRNVESPISESSTWQKIASNRSDALTDADKPVIYALMRHLEFRTPHARQTGDELIEQCKAHPEKFSDEEREMYRTLHQNPELKDLFFVSMAASLDWTEKKYLGCGLTICRTEIPLRSSTTPIQAIRAPDHPSIYLPLPNQTPFTLTMTLNRNTFACLTLGDFGENSFLNVAVPDDVARGYNRERLAQFAYFPTNQHLISDRQNLIEDMIWAPYDLEMERQNKIVFCRRKGVK